MGEIQSKSESLRESLSDCLIENLGESDSLSEIQCKSQN